jgi:hypothetical protein
MGFLMSDCSVGKFESQVGKNGSQVGKIALQVGIEIFKHPNVGCYQQKRILAVAKISNKDLELYAIA